MASKSGTQRVISLIADAIDQGNQLPELQQQFKERPLRHAYADFAHNSPQRLTRIFGQAASAHSILIDENLDISLIPLVHTHLGRPDTVQNVFEKGIQDTDLFAKSHDKNIRAIITNDGMCKGKKDLSGVANAAYQHFDNQPGIIVVSQDVQIASDQIIRNQAAILDYLDHPRPEILTL